MIYLISFLLSHAFALDLKPPVAAQVPHELKNLGDTRQDPYFWLREKEKPETIQYLKDENAYANEVLKPRLALKEKILKELKSHILENEIYYPVKKGDYLYQSKTVKGKEYRIMSRAPVKGGKQTLLLDVNDLNPSGSYTNVNESVVSDDAQILVYSLDTKGDRKAKIFFKDLKTGTLLPDTIENTAGDFVWAADIKTVFYVRYEPVTLRARYVFRHTLGEKEDVLVYDEPDVKFDVGLHRSLSQRLIFVGSHSKNSNEVRFVPADTPKAALTLVQARQPDMHYSVEDGGDRFFITTNWDAVNFRLMDVDPAHPEQKNWHELVAHRPDFYIRNVTVFENYLVLEGAQGGLSKIEVMDRKTGKIESLKFKDPVYTASVDDNEEYDSPKLRFSYSSMTTPLSIYEYEFKTKKQIAKWHRQVPGGFQSSNYKTERLWATASDGTKIPISIVYRKDKRLKKPQDLLLYGYGSYGTQMTPYFSSNILPLLDRGFVYAIAHVRGGSEMGRSWYLDGKLFKKKNTFTDFIACAEYLIHEGWTSPKHLYASGRSAGGLLMGAVANMRPDLFKGIIAGVPFVDVVTTMLDASLPLTTAEYEEWGNPNEKPAYEYIKSYSPYDNVKKQAYPNLFVSAGLNDTQVGYWEPAKWVAKLRSEKTDANLLIFKTEMGAGHQGKNGRFSGLEKTAEEDAFLLTLAR